jgi:type II restriction enzyme
MHSNSTSCRNVFEKLRFEGFPYYTLFPKGKFRHLAKSYGVQIPQALQERTPDFSIQKGEQLLSLEVNFYSGQGSKPLEIVDAYINRQRELKRSGWEFVWITDGNGWRKG